MNKKRKKLQQIRISVWMAIMAVVMIFLLIIWLSVIDTPQ